MFIDTHNHVIPTEALELLSGRTGFGVNVADNRWTNDHHVSFPIVDSFYDPEARLRQMASVGIDAAVVSPPPALFLYTAAPTDGTELCAAANEGMAKYCAHRPDRLRWLANLPLQAVDDAVESYRRAIADGAVGAAVGTSVAGRRLDEEDFERFWAVAAEVGRPVLVHPAFNEAHAALTPFYLQNVIGNPLETTVMVERMICAGVFARHPHLKLVVLHGGGFLPYQAGRLQHARQVRPELAGCPEDTWAAFGQLYFDTITHDTAALRFLAEKVGADHVVLGTDMPFDMAMQTPMATLRQAFDEDTVARIASANPARLFGFGDG